MDAKSSAGVPLSSPAAAQRCAEGAGLDSGAPAAAQSAMPSIATSCHRTDRRSLFTNAAAPAAPQLQSRISTSLTDVTSWGTGTSGRSCRARTSRSPSNPSWGTGTPSLTASVVIYRRLPTPHGEREPGAVRALQRIWCDFQPLMGNGNHANQALPIDRTQLPTPHGERERVGSPRAIGKPLGFQPLMGNGNRVRSGALNGDVTIFQPLMGNGNS